MLSLSLMPLGGKYYTSRFRGEPQSSETQNGLSTVTSRPVAKLELEFSLSFQYQHSSCPPRLLLQPVARVPTTGLVGSVCVCVYVCVREREFGVVQATEATASLKGKFTIYLIHK